MALAACPTCSGLVPSGRSHCVHCDAPLATSGPGRWRWLRALLAASAAGAATITLMACYGGPSTYDDCLDNDGDGWFPGCYDEPCDPLEDPYCDCNDFNPNIHPGAADPLGDRVDSDCSGDDGPAKCGEESCPDAAYYPDAPPDAQVDAPVGLPDAATTPDATPDAQPDA
jgi:hypothetical protein